MNVAIFEERSLNPGRPTSFRIAKMVADRFQKSPHSGAKARAPIDLLRHPAAWLGAGMDAMPFQISYKLSHHRLIHFLDSKQSDHLETIATP
jgi:hypothetical protein